MSEEQEPEVIAAEVGFCPMCKTEPTSFRTVHLTMTIAVSSPEVCRACRDRTRKSIGRQMGLNAKELAVLALVDKRKR